MALYVQHYQTMLTAHQQVSEAMHANTKASMTSS